MSPEKTWALTLLVVVLIGVCSCASPANESPPSQPSETESPPVSPAITISIVDEAIVQVWDSDILAATGIVTGDGSQVLTVINFEESVPNGLDVVAAGSDRYHASIQAIDPRTGVTLLKIEATSLPVASTGDVTSLVPNQQLIARWCQQPYRGSSPGEPEMKKTELLILPDSGGAPVNFGVYFPPGAMSDIPHVGS